MKPSEALQDIVFSLESAYGVCDGKCERCQQCNIKKKILPCIQELEQRVDRLEAKAALDYQAFIGCEEAWKLKYEEAKQTIEQQERKLAIVACPVEEINAKIEQQAKRIAELADAAIDFGKKLAQSNIDNTALRAERDALHKLLGQAGAVCKLFEQSGGYRMEHPNGSTCELKGLPELIQAIDAALAANPPEPSK